MKGIWAVSIIASILILGSLGFSQTSYGQVADFKPPFNLSQSTFLSGSQQVAVNGDFVYMVWAENNSVLFKRSTNGGQTFSSTPLPISSTSGFKANLLLAATGSFVYVAWGEQSSGPMGEDLDDIFFSRSTDNGVTFSSPQNLSQSTSSDSPALAISGNNVYVGWREGTGFDRDNFVAISSNNGLSFPSIVDVSQGTDVSSRPSLATNGNELYVAWTEIVLFAPPEIFFSKSVNNGPFSTPINISNTPSVSSFFPISILSEGNFVYIIWRESNDSFIAISSDRGDNFGAGKDIVSTINCQSGIRAATSGNDIYAVWSEPCSIPTDIKFAKSSDNGGIFSSSIDLSSTSGDSGFDGHSIIATGGNIYVAWIDQTTGNGDPYITLSENEGASFVSPIIVSNDPGAASPFQTISLAGSGNVVYMTWSENVSGSFDVFFSTNACIPPSSSDWIVDKSCTLTNTSVAPADVIIQNNSVLTIPNGLTLDIDFTANNLTVQSGSGVLIKAGGKIT